MFSSTFTRTVELSKINVREELRALPPQIMRVQKEVVILQQVISKRSEFIQSFVNEMSENLRSLASKRQELCQQLMQQDAAIEKFSKNDKYTVKKNDYDQKEGREIKIKIIWAIFLLLQCFLRHL